MKKFQPAYITHYSNYIGRLKTPHSDLTVKLLCLALAFPNSDLNWQAAIQLCGASGIHEFCSDLILGDGPVAQKKAAAYVLANLSGDAHHSKLIALVKCKNIPSSVRAHLLEGLGNAFQLISPKHKNYIPAAHAARSALEDVSPTIRYWACFALGAMRCKSALPELKRMMKKDRKKASSLGSIANQACWAIDLICEDTS